MSDSQQTALDPNRPWITDRRELPSHMNWVQTLFNPTGESPRLHFTRAWTALFVAQLLIVVVPVTVGFVIDLAGGDGSPVRKLGLYVSPVIFVVTTMMSYVIHSRRLIDARKPQILAIIPLVPLLIGLALFAMTAMGTAAQYDQRFETRQQYLADPEAFMEKQREAQREAQRKAQEEAAANGAEEGGQQAQSGQRRGGPPGGRGQGMGPEQPLPPKGDFIMKAAAPTIQTVIIPISALIAIWSLMWVARVPFFGRYPGEDSDESRAYQS